MNPHVSEWLSAYYDGELASNRRRQVDIHLQECLTCRAELESYGKLASLLKAAPVPERTSAARFAAQVQLRLPRTLPPRARQHGLVSSRSVLSIPLALILVWAFLEAAIRVTALILTADNVLGTAFFSGWVSPEGLLETNASLLVFDAFLLIGMTILWSAWMAFWLVLEKTKMNSIQKEV